MSDAHNKEADTPGVSRVSRGCLTPTLDTDLPVSQALPSAQVGVSRVSRVISYLSHVRACAHTPRARINCLDTLDTLDTPEYTPREGRKRAVRCQGWGLDTPLTPPGGGQHE